LVVCEPIGELDSSTRRDHVSPDRWQRDLAEARDVLSVLRSLGEDSEAEQLEHEIAEVELHLARLRWSMSSAGQMLPEPGVGVSSWPAGHVAWVFSGATEYELGAKSFLTAGAARGERLVYVADSPVPEHWPAGLVERGELLLVRVSDAYLGPLDERLERFAGLLADSLGAGYTGL
jgi:hypothetical protein